MSIVSHAIRTGVRRGRAEFGMSLRAPADISYYIFGTGVFLVVLILNRDSIVEGTGLRLATIILPGLLGMQIAISGAYGPATYLVTEREDGTLLRAKSVPNGMLGYVAGQVTRCCLETLFTGVLVLVLASLFIDDLWSGGAVGVLQVIALYALGLLATLPLGIVIGSVFGNPRSVGGWGLLILGGIIWVSGIFSPLASMAGWVQVVGQIFPVYWLGLGMRSAFLPDSAVAVEIGESWRIWETFGVLGLWAVVGLMLAPRLLRRMAQCESGSSVEARRHTAMQRV